MRSVIARPRLIIALLAACLLAGCGSQPSKIGSAALVGDQAIPVSTVQQRFEAVVGERPQLREQLDEQGRKDELARQIAAFTVRQKLAEVAARRQNLRVSEQEITQWAQQRGGARAATEGTIFTADEVRSVARSLVLMRKLGSKHLTSTSVVFDYTSATSRAEAERKANRMARGPEQAAELIRQERSEGVPAGSGRELSASRALSFAAQTPLFAADEGTVLAFPGPGRQSAGQWLVARITERTTGNGDGQSSTPSLGSQGEQLTQAFGSRLLGLTAQRVGVELSPRYGVWDSLELTVAPDEGQTSGFRIPERESRA
ncbi:SurA N-terminal domain-containing protein [Actinopolyspora lacussalsi]|uniref:SurA N-terminal domain-containing protein n=1 Tax=Actinopolyspora righensis TaxID=995060 RepID=UPI000A93E546|nr:SurA N-terminal domain-containing protein [Actinopolyspora righensis]